MTERLRLVVSGATGRMGRALAQATGDDDSVMLMGGIGRSTIEANWASTLGYPDIQAPESAAWLLRKADAVIDFSSPELFRRLVDAQREALAGCALVVGTTGLEPDDLALLQELAERGPVLPAPNFSVGVNLLMAIVEQAARVLDESYDIEIVEAHHRRKADAPSGTALQLGRAAARGRGGELDELRRDSRSGQPGERPHGEIGFHAIRGGDIVGEYRVMYIGERERIELSHVATDRSLFGLGALRAARWLVGRPAGLYSMRDVLGIT